MSENIVVVAHKFLTQPDDDFVIYLNIKKYPNVLHICHSFNETSDRCSYFTWYKNGEVYKKERTKDFVKWPEPFLYIKEMFFTLKWVFESGEIWHMYIGMDGLTALFGEILKTFGKVKKTIYWVIDFVPTSRFDSNLKNWGYRKINTSSYKRVDEVWDLSPRMSQAREKCWGLRESDYKSRKVVPYGVWLDRIRRYTYDECEKNTLVFMGLLLPKQGVQLVIKAIPEIIQHIPDFNFIIIGGGAYRAELEKLAKNLNVLNHCDFKGKIESDETLEGIIAKSCVAIAPYIKELDTWTYYADPGKIKKYLACGVPVLLTDVPWNASEIQENGCGKIILADSKEIANSVVEFITMDSQIYRDSALKYAQKFDYPYIFDSLIL